MKLPWLQADQDPRLQMLGQLSTGPGGEERENALGLSGLSQLPLRCFCNFRSHPGDSEVPKPAFLASLSSCLTCLDCELLAQGLNWPPPWSGGAPEALCACHRVGTLLQTPNTHVSAAVFLPN